MEELEDAAKKLTIKDDAGNVEVYGYPVARLGPPHHRELRDLSVEFRRLLDHAARTASACPTSIHPSRSTALEFYGRMIRDYAPEAALNNRPNDNANLFAAGKAAMLSGLNYYIYQFEDPKQVARRRQGRHHPGAARPGRQLPEPADHLVRDLAVLREEGGGLDLHRLDDRSGRRCLNAQKSGAPMCRKSVWTDPSYKPPAPGWGESGPAGARVRHRDRQAAGRRDQRDA